MSLDTWIAFCLTETVLCFTPGPAVLLVVSVALGRGLRPSLGAALGILTANTLYFALSATGIAAAFVASRELFLALKWCGAVYLIWLGLRMVFSRKVPELRPCPVVLARSFYKGFVIQGSNPKALIFFMALLPQFIDPTGSVPLQVVVLGASSIFIELTALVVYAFVAVRVGEVASERVARLLERLGGGLLVAAGAQLAAIRSE